jgi:hypothetical protein
MASGWSVVTLVSVMEPEAVTRLAMRSRTELTVEGVNVSGSGPRLPESLVA